MFPMFLCSLKEYVLAEVLSEMMPEIVGYGNFGYFDQSGSRFSRKAFLPSFASSDR